MKTERMFPIQGEHDESRVIRPAGQVPWGVAELAYKTYAKFHGKDQTLERLAERCGFSWTELVTLLQGKRLGDGEKIPAIVTVEP